MMKGIDFAAPKHGAADDEVNFDQKRFEQALAGDRFVMPEGMSREQFREWMRGNARKCRSR